MSLGIKLVQAVQKETAMKRPLPLCAIVHGKSPGGKQGTAITASVTLTDNDRFSHLAEDVTIHVQGPKSKAQSPKVTAERFAARATYLTESLQFVEIDGGGTALLRSSPETMRAPRTPYFEARVDDSAIALKRYQPHPDKPGREAIPFCVTDEVLARLVDDAVAVLTPPRK
ncbi:MAG: hypothetical protein M3347_04675 [Armatimonadota bacterium]|nr:hypothetical protein [Armatimonadota bacterium]